MRGDDAGGDNDASGDHEHTANVTSADDLARLLRRFNGSVAFTDAPSGFFGFLRDTFAQLAREEDAAAWRERTDAPDYPSFGHAEDDYDDVVKTFYARWAGFSTRKTFAWRDRYRASEAEDRRMRRLVEKENRRFRDEGVREFNDAVRALVAFVKKRDPRFEPNAQSDAERQKALRDAAAAQAARSRAENLKKMEGEAVPQWAQTQAPDDNEGQVSDEESEEEQFECVACKKIFKSERQFEAHEKSKKHTKAVQSLRRQLQKEGAGLDIDEIGDSSGILSPAFTVQEVHAVEEVPVERDGREIESGDDSNGSALDSNNTANDAASTSMDTDNETPGLSTDRTPQTDLGAAMEKLDASYDYASPAHTATNTTPHPLSATATPSSPNGAASSVPSPPSELTSPSTPPSVRSLPVQSQTGAAAQKRQKKAAAAAAAAASSQHSAGAHICVACSAAFPSKTRLFQHIKDFGHAAPVPGSGKGRGGKKR